MFEPAAAAGPVDWLAGTGFAGIVHVFPADTGQSYLLADDPLCCGHCSELHPFGHTPDDVASAATEPHCEPVLLNAAP